MAAKSRVAATLTLEEGEKGIIVIVLEGGAIPPGERVIIPLAYDGAHDLHDDLCAWLVKVEEESERRIH